MGIEFNLELRLSGYVAFVVAYLPYLGFFGENRSKVAGQIVNDWIFQRRSALEGIKPGLSLDDARLKGYIPVTRREEVDAELECDDDYEDGSESDEFDSIEEIFEHSKNSAGRALSKSDKEYVVRLELRGLCAYVVTELIGFDIYGDSREEVAMSMMREWATKTARDNPHFEIDLKVARDLGYLD